jgi:hypothetical protein
MVEDYRYVSCEVKLLPLDTRQDLVALLAVGGDVKPAYIYSGISGTVRSSFILANVPTSSSPFMEVDYSDQVISVDPAAEAVYINEMATGIFVDSFVSACSAAAGITVDSQNNIVLADGATSVVYIHSGVSSAVTSSFLISLSNLYSAAMDRYDNLVISRSPSVNPDIIVFDGITSTIDNTFASPFAPDGAYTRALTVDADNNLVSAQSDTYTVYIHSGITATISSTFSISALDAMGIAYAYTPAGISYVSGATEVQSPTLQLSYVSGATKLLPATEGNLVSSDQDEDRVYIHSGITDTITSSFQLLGGSGNPRGITQDLLGNLIWTRNGDKLYINEGMTNTITTSYFMSGSRLGARGLAMKSDGDMLSGGWTISGFGIVEDVLLHSGTTSTAAVQFTIPIDNTEGLDLDGDENLVSISVPSSNSEVLIHSGITDTITSSFTVSGVNGTGIAVENNGNLILCENTNNKIYLYDGLTSSLLDSFSAPSSNISSLMVRSITFLEYVSGATTLLAANNLEFVSGATTLAAANNLEYLSGAALLLVTPAEYIPGAVTLLVTPAEYIPGATTLAAVNNLESIPGSCTVQNTVREYVLGETTLQAGEREYAPGSTTLLVDNNLEYLSGATELAIDYVGGLITCDLSSNKIYIHHDITGSILTSFASPDVSPNGVGLTADRNLLSVDAGTNEIYIHSGLTSTVTTTISGLSYTVPSGAEVDSSGNIVGASQGDRSIYIHSGTTSTITSSFSAPDTSGTGGALTGIGLDESGNLVTLVTSGHGWGNQSKVSIHAGITSTITSSFENALESDNLLLTGIDVDENGNVVTCNTVTQRIRVHVGKSLTIATSFSSPDIEPSGIAIRPVVTAREYLPADAMLAGAALESVPVVTEVMGSALDSAPGSCLVVVGSLTPGVYLQCDVTLQVDTREYAPGEARLDLPGLRENVPGAVDAQVDTREYVPGACTLSSISTIYEYCRDGRDFLNIPGAYSSGTGYGYDALTGGWGSSAGHGADYTSARHITAADSPPSNQTTQFNDGYVNSEGFSPVNVISGFVSGTYNVWVYLNGAGGSNTLGITVGSETEVTIEESGSGSWEWVSVGSFSVDSTTNFQFRHISDGSLHAIRHLMLKSIPGPPTTAPTGAEGDCTETSFGQQEFIDGAVTLQVDTREYLPGAVEVMVSATESVPGAAVIPLLESVPGYCAIDGEPFLENVPGAATVADAAAEYVPGRCDLDGELFREYIIGEATVAIEGTEYVPGTASLDGEIVRENVLGDATIMGEALSYLPGSSELDTSTIRDSFTVFVTQSLRFTDDFDVISGIVGESVTLQDDFTVKELLNNLHGFEDNFTVISTAVAAVLDADVLRISIT